MAVTASTLERQKLSRNEVVGIALMALRKLNRLTQHDAAAYAGIHPVTLSEYENGKGKMTFETVGKLCELYGTSPADLENIMSAMAGWVSGVMDRRLVSLR